MLNELLINSHCFLMGRKAHNRTEQCGEVEVKVGIHNLTYIQLAGICGVEYLNMCLE